MRFFRQKTKKIQVGKIRKHDAERLFFFRKMFSFF